MNYCFLVTRVGVAQSMWLGNTHSKIIVWFLDRGRGKRFFSSRKRPAWLCRYQLPTRWVPGWIIPRNKATAVSY